MIKIRKSSGRTFLRTKDDFFENGVIVKNFEDRLEITKPSLDYRGKIWEPSKKFNWYSTTIPFNIPIGDYFPDEDSTEDLIIIYYH